MRLVRIDLGPRKLHVYEARTRIATYDLVSPQGTVRPSGPSMEDIEWARAQPVDTLAPSSPPEAA